MFVVDPSVDEVLQAECVHFHPARLRRPLAVVVRLCAVVDVFVAVVVDVFVAVVFIVVIIVVIIVVFIVVIIVLSIHIIVIAVVGYVVEEEEEKSAVEGCFGEAEEEATLESLVEVHDARHIDVRGIEEGSFSFRHLQRPAAEPEVVVVVFVVVVFVFVVVIVGKKRE